jgi:hypothetical protein
MARKISPKLIDIEQRIYAVLSPGSGFLKEIYGDVEFNDKLPRASGSFMTKDEAVTARTRAIVKASQEVVHACARRDSPDHYFEKQARATLQQARATILVEITLREVA